MGTCSLCLSLLAPGHSCWYGDCMRKAHLQPFQVQLRLNIAPVIPAVLHNYTCFQPELYFMLSTPFWACFCWFGCRVRKTFRFRPRLEACTAPLFTLKLTEGLWKRPRNSQTVQGEINNWQYTKKALFCWLKLALLHFTNTKNKHPYLLVLQTVIVVCIHPSHLSRVLHDFIASLQ